MKQLQKFTQNTSAITSIIIALLLLGLMAITLTTIQTVYVPRWVEHHEGLHMQEVASQFADIKHALDIQTLSQDKTSISTPITLGTDQQSFLTTSRTSGSIHIKSNDVTFSISNSSDQLSFSLGSLQYISRNNYYVDQSYILEAGAVIINQTEGYIMSSDPPVIYQHQGFNLSYNFYNITERGGKTDISGFGTYLIQTNYSNTDSYNLTNITTIQIIGAHPNAWYLLLNTTLQDIGLNYGVDYSISTTSSQVNVAVSSTINISIDIITLYAQISPGRIG